MKKYTRKQKEVEAVQWKKPGDFDGVDLNGQGVASWNFKHYDEKEKKEVDKCLLCGQPGDQHGHLDTIEGGRIVCPGSWIIKKDNVVYVRSDERFKKDYD